MLAADFNRRLSTGSKGQLMLNSTFVKPKYGGRCFADLPATVKYLLTGQGQPELSAEILAGLPARFKNVIFFFVDAFGWSFFEKYGDHYPFLQRIVREGRVAKLTAQFPSTTAAHVTCIHTGLPVGQSGVYEWQYYEPQLDAIITPLLFSFAGTKERNTLAPTGIQASDLCPEATFYLDLKAQGVHSTVIQSIAYTPSPYSEVIFRGAEVVPYRTFPEALTNLGALLRQPQTNPSYYFLYYASIDSICHPYGPDSAHVEAEIDLFWTMMERLFFQKLGGQLQDTLLILTADHGHVAVDPQTTIYLNREDRFAGFERFLKTNRRGKYLIPAGSSRDMFLYIKDEHLTEAHAFLSERLTGHADVCPVQDLIAAGYFGPLPLSDAFLARVGNLVILPYRHETVWWYEKGKFENKFYGHHGGLTPDEMETPLLLYPF